jgi:uncharacterized protein YjfI (DUF2170 family)
VSKSTELRYLECQYNLLTTLDLRKNTRLWFLECQYNKLSTLNVSENAYLYLLYCNENSLPLSELYKIVEMELNDIRLGPQTLPTQTVEIGKTLEFAVPQNIFNGYYTTFTVTQNWSPAPQSDYSVNEGKITFHKLGRYTVAMTHREIISVSAYPAKVTFDVVVGNVGMEELKMENGELKIYPNPTSGQLIIDNGELKIENVAIYDVVGRTVGANLRVCPENTIDVSHLAQGMYYLKMGNKVVKFVKK